MAIKPIIESMIAKANETTGKADTDLTNAIQSLADGFGQGGGGLPDTIVAGDTPVLASSEIAKIVATTTVTATGIKVTIPKTGTYRFRFSCGRTNTSDDWTTQLYKNDSAVSGAIVTWSTYMGDCTADIECSAGDTVEIYAKSRGSNYRNIVGQLIACIDWVIFN